MKKILIGIFVLSSLAFGKIQDGKYYVESEKAMWGWKPFTYMVVENGEIVELKHDRKNKANKNASEDKKYNDSMTKKKGLGIKEASQQLENSYMESKDVDKVDDVAGATTTSKEFRAMVKFLLEKAEKGEPGNYKMSNKELM